MLRSVVVAASATVVLVSACGGPSPAPSAPSGTSAVDAAGSPAATTSVQPAKPTAGIVVATEQAGVIEIGMIDPANGSYAVENTFDVGDFAKGVNEPDIASAIGFSMVVAPDRARVMAQREVNGDWHTGWLTADGEFVDVTAATQGERTDFSGPVSSFGVGFNTKGDFAYGVNNGDAIEIWSLPNGRTTEPVLLTTVDMLTRYQFGADGNLEFALSDPCDDFSAYSWMGDWILYSDGTQIYRAPRIPAVGECGSKGQPLLPETNTARVSDPVASPDLREVAFIYTNADGSRAIYIVAADGSSKPRKIDNVQWPDSTAHLVGWV